MKMHLVLCALIAGLSAPAVTEDDLSYDWNYHPFGQYTPATPMEAHLQDVAFVFSGLAALNAYYNENYYSDAAADKPSVEARVAYLKETTEKLRPACERLRALPADELLQLVLLADAIAWQRDWVIDSYKSAHSDVIIPEHKSGLEILVTLSYTIRRKLSYSSTSQEEVDALLSLLSLFGGVDSLLLPSQLLDQRIAKDYKTAYYFFADFVAATQLTDEEACLRRLAELAPLLDYLLQGGEADCLRVAALADAYAYALRRVHGKAPKHLPLLPAESPESEREKALNAFFDKLPALRHLFCGIKMQIVDKW